MKHSTYWYARKIEQAKRDGRIGAARDYEIALYRAVLQVYAEGGGRRTDPADAELARNALTAGKGEKPYEIPDDDDDSLLFDEKN